MKPVRSRWCWKHGEMKINWDIFSSIKCRSGFFLFGPMPNLGTCDACLRRHFFGMIDATLIDQMSNQSRKVEKRDLDFFWDFWTSQWNHQLPRSTHIFFPVETLVTKTFTSIFQNKQKFLVDTKTNAKAFWQLLIWEKWGDKRRVTGQSWILKGFYEYIYLYG